METLCQVEGCTNVGTTLDNDRIFKCNEHLAEAMLANKIEIKNISRNDPCHCDSGRKYKKCCGNLNDKRRQWFIQRITRTVYYTVLPYCTVPDCETCEANRLGINIQNIQHARMLHEWEVENKNEFLDKKPKYHGQIDN